MLLWSPPSSVRPTEMLRDAPGGVADWRSAVTILIVDDEEIVRGVLRDMCESAGCAVLTAKDGKEGVEAFREHAHEISLVMLDMTMPHMGGPETFQAIRKIQPDARVVLMSGHNEVEAASRFVGKGLAGFLQKPISLSSPYGKMQEVLD